MSDSTPIAAIAPQWLEVGRIVGAQGLKGEVRVYPDSDFPERFEQPGSRWLLYPGQSEPEPIELLSGRFVEGKGIYILRFADVSDRSQAEALRDCRLLVPTGDRPALEAGEFHVLDLIGLSVFDQSSQVKVGTIVDVISAGNDLLEIELETGTVDPPRRVLVPFVEAIVPIVDLEAKRVEITPPAGLID
jgi:16S rRNA processing protein RimM